MNDVHNNGDSPNNSNSSDKVATCGLIVHYGDPIAGEVRPAFVVTLGAAGRMDLHVMCRPHETPGPSGAFSKHIPNVPYAGDGQPVGDGQWGFTPF